VSLLVLALLLLALCVILCLQATTLTAAAMQRRVIVLSTLGGWAFIALWLELLLPQRREIVHETHMLNGDREYAEGELTVTGELLRIPRSAPLMKAELRCGETTRSLSISPQRADQFGCTPVRGRFWTVFGCVVAWEASDAND